MSKKISHTLVGGRTVAGTGGQGLKIGEQGRLYWLDVDESSLVPLTWYGSRGVFGGALGNGNSFTNSGDISYITIASTGNATDFGNLSSARQAISSCANKTYGLFGGGSTDTIDYVTIATTANAADFGNLSSSKGGMGACSDGTKGVFGGGGVDVIEYVTIATPGNVTDFGDLTSSREGVSSCSGD